MALFTELEPKKKKKKLKIFMKTQKILKSPHNLEKEVSLRNQAF